MKKVKITIYSIIIILFGSKSHNKKYIFERSTGTEHKSFRKLGSCKRLTVC